jgi:hypothetical protein
VASVTQQLLDTTKAQLTTTIVLRSGKTISGLVERVDLNDDVTVIDGWSIRIEEIAGLRHE